LIFFFCAIYYNTGNKFLCDFLQPATPLINRPPLPTHVANNNSPQVHHHWENATVKRTDSFNSIVSPPPKIPQCYPNNATNFSDNNFVNQTQQSTSSLSQIRRHVPLPNGHNNMPTSGPPIPQRNMSSSVFNLNHAGYHPQQHHAGYQPQNAWGMNPMGQVCYIYAASNFT
jgi:hypothetical protein